MTVAPSEINQLHQHDDADVSNYAHHHTLGTSPGQASPGNHNHDGVNSIEISGKSVYTSTWRWTTATSGAPSSGYVGGNTGAWNTITHVRINKTNRDGASVPGGTGIVGSDIYLQDKGDSGKYGRYGITAVVDNGTWLDLTVSHVGSGGTPPANNADTLVSFILSSGGGGGGGGGGAGFRALAYERWRLNSTFSVSNASYVNLGNLALDTDSSNDPDSVINGSATSTDNIFTCTLAGLYAF